MDGKERSRRPLRNKRYNRRAFDEDKRPPKRLFTPEIKRFLKDWLVRRRDNPYPNRDEKKTLAVQTGLTYIQVCNWFANWRRKLKNAGKEPQRKTWGHLIKTYNSQVHGNVEHFSICSEDSIWHEPEASCKFQDFYTYEENYHKRSSVSSDPNNPPRHNDDNNNDHDDDNDSRCFLVSSTNTASEDAELLLLEHSTGSKYKSHIMEKYLRDCQRPENLNLNLKKEPLEDKPSMISRWLESAVNFKPSRDSYLNWTFSGKKGQRKRKSDAISYQQHGREELDAAEALTKLANAYGSRKIT